jgi:hypothetical protein
VNFFRSAHEKFLFLASTVFFTVFVGAAVFHFLEGWSWLDCFYFAVTTITTVGYGDLHPTKALTKVFIMFYIFAGVAIAYYALNALGQYWMERRQGFFSRNIENVVEAVEQGRAHGSRLRHRVRAHGEKLRRHMRRAAGR